MERSVVLSPDAVRQLKKMSAGERTRLRGALIASLSKDDATVETRNRFRLHRPSEFADFELRVDDMRVCYRVRRDQVQVVLIGRKKGNHLLIGRRRFTL